MQQCPPFSFVFNLTYLQPQANMGPKVNKSEANRKQTIFQWLFLCFVVEERENVAVSLLSTVRCSVSIFKLYMLKYLIQEGHHYS